jgi:hypothetical protein
VYVRTGGDQPLHHLRLKGRLNVLHPIIVRGCTGDRGSSPGQFKLGFFLSQQTKP